MLGKQPRLRDRVRAVIRVNRYSIRTEKTYWYWIRYFIRFHQMKHPREMGPREVNEFLTWLAVNRNVAAATQAQALNALVFLAPDEQALDGLLDALAERRAWQKIVDERLQHNLTASQDNQAAARIEQATTKVHARIPETWCHLLIPYQSEPGPNGALWEEKRLNGAKGSLPERASSKCI